MKIRRKYRDAFIEKWLTSGKIIAQIIHPIDVLIGVVFRNIFYCFGKIQNNKIFVMTYDNDYTCNPSYIVSELLRRNEDVDIVWAVDGKSESRNFPPSVRLVKRGSFEMFEEMASAKVWIDNALNCVWYGMPKKRQQVYINTWHGSMGIKRLHGNRKWMLRAKQCKRKTNYCVSNSEFEDQVYRETFWPNTPILKYGHARNDLFFDEQGVQQATEKVREYFGLDAETKLFLYAPTFRDDGDTACYDMNYARVKSELEFKFGGEWVVLLRLHYKNRAKGAGIESEEGWIDASKYPDMQELMAAADIGATDYSSWAYDYILMGRPLFIYATDLCKYNSTRGLYYQLETTPFPVAECNEMLIENIKSFDDKSYQKKVEQFLLDKGCVEDGKASQRVSDLILNCIG